MIAEYFPLTPGTIRAYAGVWDWKILSRNRRIAWTPALVDEHARRWDWEAFRGNEALPWSVDFIDAHVRAGHFEWSSLWAWPLLGTEDLARLALRRWSENEDRWAGHGGRYTPVQFAPWGDGDWAARVVVETANLDWSAFSSIERFPWTVDFIAEHADRLDWHRLSWNGGLPWGRELMSRFADRLEWDHLSYKLVWTPELFREFADRIDWQMLGDVAWTNELVDEFADRIWWGHIDDSGIADGYYGILNHAGLELTPERRTRLDPIITARFGEGWTALCDTSNWSAAMFDAIALEEIDWEAVAGHAKTPWTDEFLARHAERLTTYYLASNPHVPMARLVTRIAAEPGGWHELSKAPGLVPSEALLDDHEHWDWALLSNNPHLTPAIVERFADRWDWDTLADNACVPLAVLDRHRDRISEAGWRDLSRRKLASDPAFDPRAPWDWEWLLRADHEVRLADYLETGVVVAYLDAVRAGRDEPRHAAIEAQLATELADPDAFLVYADWLIARDDPHGQLIALAIRARGDAGLAAEATAAAEAYGRRLDLDRERAIWRLGFLDELYGAGKDWPRYLRGRACRFLRSLAFNDHHAPRAPAELAILGELTCLERVGLVKLETDDVDVLRELPRLRDVRLDHAPITDLGFVATLPRLEQLGVWNTAIVDLEPLAGVRSLVALHCGHTRVARLDPLRGLDRLVELDIRYSGVKSLAPVEDCPALRRLYVESSGVSAGELARFSAARPDVRVLPHADYPGDSTMMPFWDYAYWTPVGEPRSE